MLTIFTKEFILFTSYLYGSHLNNKRYFQNIPSHKKNLLNLLLNSVFLHLSFQQTSKRIAPFNLISYFCNLLSF